MITLIAAALAAAAPAAQPADAHAQHGQGQAAEHKGKDCCKDGSCKCCDHMAKNERHGDEHGHPAQ